MAARGLKTGEHVIEREAEEDWRKRRVRDSPFSRVVSVVSYRVLPVNIAYIIVIVDVVVCTRATLISNWYHRANQYCVRTWLPVSVMTSQFRNGTLFKKKRIVRVRKTWSQNWNFKLESRFLLFLVLGGSWSWLKSLNVWCGMEIIFVLNYFI